MFWGKYPAKLAALALVIHLSACSQTDSGSGNDLDLSSGETRYSMEQLRQLFVDSEKDISTFWKVALAYEGKPGYEDVSVLLSQADLVRGDEIAFTRLESASSDMQSLGGCISNLSTAITRDNRREWFSEYWEAKHSALSEKVIERCVSNASGWVSGNLNGQDWASLSASERNGRIGRELRFLEKWSPVRAEELASRILEIENQEENDRQRKLERVELLREQVPAKIASVRLVSDEFDTEKVYRAKASANTRLKTTIFFEVSQNQGGSPSLQIVFQFYGSTWLFIKRAEALADQALLYLDGPSFFSVQRDVVNSGVVEYWERWLRDEGDIRIARDLASAESVKIKYTGDGDAEKIWTMSSSERLALREMLDLHDAMLELYDLTKELDS